MTSYHDWNDLKQVSVRLSTFQNWPLDFLSPEALAKNGFFYLKFGDAVQCSYCRGRINEWTRNDVISEEHRRHYEFCPFVQKKISVENISMDSLDNSIQSYDTCERYATSDFRPYSFPERGDCIKEKQTDLKFNFYNIYDNRIKSFDTWKLNFHWQAYADNGFFYTGLSDHIQCAICNIKIRNIDKNEPVIKLHERLSPGCLFLESLKNLEIENSIKNCAICENEPANYVIKKCHYARSTENL